MPLSFRQAGSNLIAGPNITIYPSGNTFAISGAASGGGGSGTAVTGLTSAGTGNILVFSAVTNNNTVLVQKSLSAGTGVAIIDDGNGTVTFSATSSGGIISGANVGTGPGLVFSGVVGTNMFFRTIRAGANAGILLSGNDIIISATTGSVNGITGLTNVGGGAAFTSSVTSNILFARTIAGTNGLDVFESGNTVVVRPSTGLSSNRFIIAGTAGSLLTSDFYQTDSTVGTMALGFNTPQTITDTRLLIAQGTAAISQIRLTPFAARYTGATAGDITYNSTSGNSLLFNKTTTLQTPFIFKDNNFSLIGTNDRIINADSAGTLSTIYYPTQLSVFNSITSTTVSGTTERSILNTGSTVLIGTSMLNSSLHGTVPQLVIGKKFRFNAKGTITTASSSAGSLNARMKLGSVVVASSSTILQTSISSNYFEIDCTFTIRGQGTTGSVVGSGKMLTDAQYLASLITPIAPITSQGIVTINTTNDTPFEFTLQNTSNANNIYRINEATLEYLN